MLSRHVVPRDEVQNIAQQYGVRPMSSRLRNRSLPSWPTEEVEEAAREARRRPLFPRGRPRQGRVMYFAGVPIFWEPGGRS